MRGTSSWTTHGFGALFWALNCVPLQAAAVGQGGKSAESQQVNAFAALLKAIAAGKQSQDLAKAMQSLKEDPKGQDVN